MSTLSRRVILIDSPFANIASIARALRASGAELRVTRAPEEIATAERIVLPGVGSFAAAMAWLTANGVDRALHAAVRNEAYLLGICVGHQLLFESSDEMGATAGLRILEGAVRRLDGVLPVPQIGWNRVRGRGPLFDGIGDETPFYFVNSYAARGVRSETASADYGGRFTAAAQNGRVFGVQFHPEKSSAAGLRVVRNFLQCT